MTNQERGVTIVALAARFGVRGHVRAFECGPVVAESLHSKGEPISVYSCPFVVF
jgi:hypothetical protein